MDISLLVESFVGLISLLGVLMFFLLYAPSKKRAQELQRREDKKREDAKEKTDFFSLLEIIRNKKTSSPDLKKTLDLIIQYHGDIKAFKYYAEILLKICKHPNTTKHIILNFNKELEKRNPHYASEINDFISQGLNSRSQ